MMQNDAKACEKVRKTLLEKSRLLTAKAFSL